MAFKCGFFNAVNGDRKYNAEEMNIPYKKIVSNGVFASDTESEDLQVISTIGLNLIVKSGFGIFADKWANLDSDLSLTVPTPHVSNTRIDSIIVRVDKSDAVRAGTIEYVQGEPSVSPVPVALQDSTLIKEYRLAKITVAPNATFITQADIEDCRPTSECGFITNLLQNSDITATYRQWQAQFENWLANTKSENDEIQNETIENQEQFDEWFAHVKEEVGAATLVKTFTSNYVSVEDGETIIPINIDRYVVEVDSLLVYINGILLIPNVEYTINDYQSITLTSSIEKNNNVSFVVLKSIDGTGGDTIVEEVARLSTDIENIKAQGTGNNLAAVTYSSVYTAENDNETDILINISAFNSNSDILQVFVNGLKLIQDVDYTLNDFETITLTKGVDAGTVVSFSLLKFVEGAGSDLLNIVNLIPAEATEENKLADKAYVDSLVSSGSGSGGSAANSVNFTYVVDSDQALLDWAKNVDGNDYTSVLIRKGEWTTTTGVNLTITGTKVVVGEAGSKLVFTPTAGINCLAYSTTPNTSDYYMNGVYVEGVSVTVCFRNCANLTNCMGVGVTRGDGFIDCLNLTNCTAVAYGNVNGNAFNSCENLTNCKGTATGGNNGYGFQNCNNLTNCEGVGKGSYMPAGFRNCVSLTNCKGTGEGGTNGYGFQGCTLVSKCKAGGKSTIRVFDTSYASQAKTSAYACADTPDGGFNDPTNPS